MVGLLTCNVANKVQGRVERHGGGRGISGVTDGFGCGFG